MSKDELIAKQQLEIEELKEINAEQKASMNRVYGYANFIQQWSIKCPDFPKMAMHHSVLITQELGH